MAQKTIPQLTEITSIDENALIPVDTGIQSYKITSQNLATSLNNFIPGGSWVSTKDYAIGDIVEYNGILWRSILAGANQNPSTTEGTYWVLAECEEAFDWNKFIANWGAYWTHVSGTIVTPTAGGASDFGFNAIRIPTGASSEYASPFLRYKGIPSVCIGSDNIGGSCQGAIKINFQWYGSDKMLLGSTSTGNLVAASITSPVVVTNYEVPIIPEGTAYYKLVLGFTSNNSLKLSFCSVNNITKKIVLKNKYIKSTSYTTPAPMASSPSYNGDYFFDTHNSSPYVRWGRYDGGALLPAPGGTAMTSAEASAASQIIWSEDDKYVAVTLSIAPYLILYSRTGDTLTRLTISSGTLSSKPTKPFWDYEDMRNMSGVASYGVAPTLVLTKNSDEEITYRVLINVSSGTVSISTPGAALKRVTRLKIEASTTYCRVKNLFGYFYYVGTLTTDFIELGSASAILGGDDAGSGRSYLFWNGICYYHSTVTPPSTGITGWRVGAYSFLASTSCSNGYYLQMSSTVRNLYRLQDEEGVF